MIAQRAWRTAAAAGVAAALVLAAPLVTGAAAAAAGRTPTAAAVTRAAAATGPDPVVVVGVPGLRWSDVTASGTPTLWRLAEGSALGSLVVRAAGPLTCPADGWLTLGAGRRAEARATGGSLQACREVPVVADDATLGSAMAAAVPSWPQLRRHNARLSYDAELGLLGRAITPAGGAVAVGPGAALAVADDAGRVTRYLAAPDLGSPSPVAAALARAPLAVIDAGAVSDPLAAGEPSRASRAAAADARVALALRAVPPRGRVLLLGLADGSATSHLGVATLSAPGGGAAWLTSASTRQGGLVLLTDVAATVTSMLGQPVSAGTDGAVLGTTPRSEALPASVETLRDADLAATVVRRMLSPFFAGLVLLQLLLYAAAAVLLRRPWGGPAGRRPVLRSLRGVATAAAAVPVATYLAQLIPWWRASWPLAAVTGLVAGWALLLALAARVAGWRTLLLWAPAVVVAVTALVLGVDVATGSRLQQASLMGYTPVVAGRFYGFGNVAYALFGTAALGTASAAAAALDAGGRRRAAVGAVVALGVVAVVVDGPVGVDFGGVLALVPAFAVLALGVAHVRVTWGRALAIAAAAVAAVAAIAVADWLRPAASRTHLGRFVAQVLDGSAVDVVQRKAEANLSVLFTFLGVVVPVAVVFLVVVLLRGLPWRGPLMTSMVAREPVLRPLSWSVATLAVVGFAVNDSGIAIPAVACMLAVPLLIAMAADSLLRDDGPGPR